MCWDTVKKDGARVLTDFKTGEKYLAHTSYPFWKKPEDCNDIRVLTRKSARKIRKNNAFATQVTIRKYFNLQKIKQ